MPYVVDTNIFIQGKNFTYPMAFFPGYWKWIENSVLSNRIVIIFPVYNEIKRGTDELSEWIEIVSQNVQYIEEDKNVLKMHKNIINYVVETFHQNKIGTFLSTDSLVIAYAKIYNCIVITNEDNNPECTRPKIPVICNHFGVACGKHNQLLEGLKPKFVLS